MAIDAPAAAAAEWAVLVYMAANNELASYAEICLAAIEAAARSEAIDVGVQIRVPGAVGAPSATTRFLRRGATEGASQQILDANMGDATTLTAFLDWGLANCPAKRTMLVVWSHGGGLEDVDGARKIAVDGTSYITDQGFRDAIARSKAGRVDVLGADACYMSMVEIAYEMRDVAGFLVSSETKEPGQSWPYAAILGALAAAPSMDAAALSRRIVSEFEAWYASPLHGDDLGYATQAAVDLGATEPLVAAVRDLAALLRAALPGARTSLGDARDAVSEMEIPDYVDLGDLLDEVEQALARSDITAATQEVRAAFGAARLASCSLGDEAAMTSGVSIYFPTAENADRFPGYADLDFAPATGWLDLLDAFFADTGAPLPDVTSEPLDLPGGLSAR